MPSSSNATGGVVLRPADIKALRDSVAILLEEARFKAGEKALHLARSWLAQTQQRGSCEAAQVDLKLQANQVAKDLVAVQKKHGNLQKAVGIAIAKDPRMKAVVSEVLGPLLA